MAEGGCPAGNISGRACWWTCVERSVAGAQATVSEGMALGWIARVRRSLGGACSEREADVARHRGPRRREREDFGRARDVSHLRPEVSRNEGGGGGGEKEHQNSCERRTRLPGERNGLKRSGRSSLSCTDTIELR